MNRWMMVAALLAFTIPAEASAFVLTLSGGVKGGVSGAAVRGVPEGDTFDYNGVQRSIPQGPELYPLFGVGAGVGGFIEVRAIDIIGLEFGLFQSWDNGNGWEDKNDANGRTIGRVTQEQRTRALHIPIMVKASVPGLIRPTFGLGLELVHQQKSTLTYRADVFDTTDLNTRYSIVPSKYALFAFSFGLEIDLGQIRIPIELRGGYNTGFNKALSERAVATGDPNRLPNFEYDGRYEGHFGIFTGVIYQFDLPL